MALAIEIPKYLIRQLNEFFNLQLSGMASDIRLGYDRDGTQVARARFYVKDVPWMVHISSTEVAPPLGKIVLDGPAVTHTGPVDAATWDEIGRLIKENSK